MDEELTKLSSAGERRRDRILLLAQQAGRVRRRWRWARRSVVMTVLVIGITVVVESARRPTVAPTGARELAARPLPLQRPVSAISLPVSRSAPPSIAGVAVLHTDPTALDRLRIHVDQQRPTWKYIDDAELFADLARAGLPGGIVRLGDRAVLVMR